MQRLIDFSSRFRILKGGKISLLVSALITSTTLLNAAPSGGVVTSGNASISQSGNVTNIHQSTQKASINWQKFNIAKHETVNFKQPNVNSITLNRVIGNEKSVINGALNANGQVWILNSNGVLFGKNAKINTSGLLATTAKLSDQDFQKGNYNFKDATSNSVINKGTIEIANNGSVILASKEVVNSGTIKVVQGDIHLVGAKEYSINLSGNSLISLKIEKGVLDSLVENSGTIINNGGKIYLTTNAVDELLKSVVNNTGTIEAKSIEDIKTHVELFAHGGIANIAGTITANDGFVETSGKKVKIDDSFKVKANKWLIDPVDFTIAASGGDMTGSTLSSNLNSTDIEIQSASGTSGTDGNIYVNDTVTWNSDKKLTLNAYNDIFINQEITAQHTDGKLALHYGQGALNAGNSSDYYVKAKVNLQEGDNFFTKLGNDGAETTWKVITQLGSEGSTNGTDLQGINGNLSGNYVLGADIDASDTASWDSNKGWKPIGYEYSVASFTGTFDGLGHTIDSLAINNTFGYAGLFGYTNGATIKNIGVTNVSISATGSHGSTYIGGLVGYNRNSSTISNSYSTGSITTTTNNTYIGGLVGYNRSSTISNSYSTASVTGGEYTWIGGLVGYNNNNSTINNSYAIGSVTGGDNGYVGGLVGVNYNTSTISNSYSTGSVTGGNITPIGGLVGYNDNGCTVSNSFWDTETSGITADDGIDGTTGLTTEEMKDSSNFIDAGWSTEIWSFSSGRGATIEGYEIGESSRPYLTSVTADADKPSSQGRSILFLGGFGTEADPYEITNWTQLQNINNSNILTQNYYFTLLNNLNSSTAGYTTQVKDGSTLANSGKGWNPIGNDSNSFEGNFDGADYIIDGLSINRPTEDYQGVFGYIKSGTIENLGVTNVEITSRDYIGGLAGVNEGTIKNIYTSGIINGNSMSGGLVGLSEGTIQNSYSNVNTSGNELIGGLIGVIVDGVVENSFASGTVTRSSGSSNDIGGLVGAEYGGTITSSYYNKETNTDTLMQDNATYGKTKAEIIELAKTNWDLEEDNTVEKDKLFLASEETGKGYTKTWVLGTKGASTPAPEPTPTPESKPTSKPNLTTDIDEIITPIVNNTIVKVDPVLIQKPIQIQPVKTNKVNVIKVANSQANKMVTLSELQTEQNIKVKVPLANN